MAKPALCTSCKTKLINGSKYNTWVRTRVRARAGYKLFQGMEIKCTFLSTDLYKRRREVNHMNELYMTSILLCHLCWRS